MDWLNLLCHAGLMILITSGALWLGSVVTRSRLPWWKLPLIAAVAVLVLFCSRGRFGYWAFAAAMAALGLGIGWFGRLDWLRTLAICGIVILLLALYIAVLGMFLGWLAQI